MFFIEMLVNIKMKAPISEPLTLKMALSCYFQTMEQTSTESFHYTVVKSTYWTLSGTHNWRHV